MADNRRKGKPRKTATQKRREARTAILQRWDQLADDAWHLEQDIRNAPRGTFTDEERTDAIFELSQTIWDALCNHRPRLPASEGRRVTGIQLRMAAFRKEVLSQMSDEKLADILAGVNVERFRRYLRGEEV